MEGTDLKDTDDSDSDTQDELNEHEIVVIRSRGYRQLWKLIYV